MRIGFFTDTYLPARSGMEISIETFRQSLEGMGHEVYVFAPTMSGYRDENQKVTRFRSMRVIKRPEMRLAFPWASVGRSLQEVRALPLDIAHTHSPFTMGLLGRHIARIQRIPFVYTNHTHHTEYAKIYFRERIVLPFLAKKWVTWFANQADGVIVPSYKFKKLFEAYGATAPLHVVQTGINLSRFTQNEKARQAAQALRARYGIPGKAEVLLYIGRMSDEKNVAFLVRVMASFARTRPETYMFFVGDGLSTRRYKDLAARLGVRNAIFTGVVPQHEIPPYYHASQAFLFASLTDTQGIVILEAMASGLPVIALEDDALKDVVKDDVNGFLVGDSVTPDIFAAKTTTVLDSRAEYKRLSLGARGTAEQFTEGIQAAKLLGLYENLIARKRHKD